MNKQVAFLRAINVAGRRIKMDELSKLFQDAGLAGVQTFLASGNVVFDPVDELPAVLEGRLEQLMLQSFGIESQVMIRGIHELEAIKQYTAFPAADIEQAGAYNVAFLKDGISSEAEEKLMALENELDRFHVHGKEVYWLCAVLQSESRFSNVVLERTIKVASTLRGISTIEKLIKKFA